jgi:hypothetical protein
MLSSLYYATRKDERLTNTLDQCDILVYTSSIHALSDSVRLCPDDE